MGGDPALIELITMVLTIIDFRISTDSQAYLVFSDCSTVKLQHSKSSVPLFNSICRPLVEIQKLEMKG